MVKYCTVCGCSIQDNDILCPKCGNNLKEDEKKHEELRNIQQQSIQYSQNNSNSVDMLLFQKNKKSEVIAVTITFLTFITAPFLLDLLFGNFSYGYFSYGYFSYGYFSFIDIFRSLLFAVFCSFGYLYIGNKEKFIIFSVCNFILMTFMSFFNSIEGYHKYFSTFLMFMVIILWLIQMIMIYQDTKKLNNLLVLQMQNM